MAAKSSKPVLGGREKVQVAIAQKSPAFMNRDACVARACAAIEEAGHHGAHLVVFPEAWLAGYPYWVSCPAHAKFYSKKEFGSLQSRKRSHLPFSHDGFAPEDTAR
jgi:predicted amidohydrolase